MMIFTVKDERGKQTYEGFNPVVSAKQKGSVLATVFVNSGVDLWYLDGQNLSLAKAELERFYRSEQGEDDLKIIIWEKKNATSTEKVP